MMGGSNCHSKKKNKQQNTAKGRLGATHGVNNNIMVPPGRGLTQINSRIKRFCHN